MAEEFYQDNAVFMPGKGAVLIGEVGAEPPTLADVRKWIEGGATGAIGGYQPLGYTSIDDLPELDSDSDGGEKKGAWENPSLRLTRVTTTETITVTPIQFSEVPLKHRFGPGVVKTDTGYFEVPSVYTSTEVSMLVVIIDGQDFLVFHYAKVASAPGDSIELDAENFIGLPIKYTVLVHQGSPKQSIGLESLKVTKGKPPATSGQGA